MPGLRRGKHKESAHKQRVLMDEAMAPPGPVSKPRAFQMPAVSPAPFQARHVPERAPTSDLPLWPGWHSDPTGRHESRYFDGIAWTDHVVDGKDASFDSFSE
jgi:hypothetical protein